VNADDDDAQHQSGGSDAEDSVTHQGRVRISFKFIYNMDYVAIHIQINPNDLKVIERILRERDIIRLVYPKDLFDQYFLGDYLEQIHVHESKFTALLDRNIFSDIIAVAKKTDTKSTTKTQQTACALLAFLQLSDTLIEPGMAIYEYIDSGYYEQAINELSLFRAVDNIHPQIFIDLALGRISSIPPSSLNFLRVDSIQELKGEDIHRWKLHYGLTLKLANIEMIGGKPYEKIEAFLKWMYTDYIFSASAVNFGLIYLSDKRITKMFKNLNCGDIDKFKKGIRNAAWDMTVAHYWMKKAIENREKGDLWLLCTEDKALKEIANFMASTYNSDEDLKERSKSLFLNYLGKKDGTRAYALYNSFVSNHNNGARRINILKSTKALYPFVEDLEKKLLKSIWPSVVKKKSSPIDRRCREK
jgi:hypothetical protein